ncbi:NAD(P)H-dependent oxidoreductase [Streptomyces sp. NPDC048504]|uniref:NAD(P)H-dependent oxidoreductase n=1 Tax=Streptomyces sp. NPDC048504 TaxID=3365559 RepID=UPI00371430CD
MGTGVQEPLRAGPAAVADQDPRPSDALTLVTPEYEGTMPAVLKNVMDPAVPPDRRRRHDP